MEGQERLVVQEPCELDRQAREDRQGEAVQSWETNCHDTRALPPHKRCWRRVDDLCVFVLYFLEWMRVGEGGFCWRGRRDESPHLRVPRHDAAVEQLPGRPQPQATRQLANDSRLQRGEGSRELLQLGGLSLGRELALEILIIV